MYCNVQEYWQEYSEVANKIKIIFLELNTILVTGGYSSLRELYYFRPEAAAGQELVQLSSSLSIDRLRPTSGLLPDEEVIIVGGNGGFTSPTSDIFDHATETVVPGPNMTQSRYAPSGTSLDGKFYVCGNFYDPEGGKQCEVYDRALNNWQPIASSEFNHDCTDLGKQAVEQK